MIPRDFSPSQVRAWRWSAALTLLRLLLAPTLIALAAWHVAGWFLAATVCAAFLSDVYDGVIARRGNAVTPSLRRADSLTDIVFYLAVAFTAWQWYRPAITPWVWGIVLLVVGEVVSNGLAVVRFRRDASYHPWTARVWGLTLFLSVVVLFAADSGMLLPVTIGVGVIAQLEAIAITLLLPEWRTDVRSARVAWRLRQSARFATLKPDLDAGDAGRQP